MRRPSGLQTPPFLPKVPLPAKAQPATHSPPPPAQKSLIIHQKIAISSATLPPTGFILCPPLYMYIHPALYVHRLAWPAANLCSRTRSLLLFLFKTQRIYQGGGKEIQPREEMKSLHFIYVYIYISLRGSGIHREIDKIRWWMGRWGGRWMDR